MERGINMGPADMLSRQDEVNTDNDTWEITLLKGGDQYFHICAIDATLTNKISLSSTSDPIITKALATMNDKRGEPWIPWTTKTDWEFIGGALYFKHWLYVPEPARHDLIKSLHELPTGGHEGFFHTLHCMQKDYWWPGMSTFLWKFITGCADCQAAKVNTHPTVPGLSPLALIMRLLDSHGFDSVMVVIDHGLMKGVIYCPCTKNINAAGVAQLFFTHVFPWFGLHSKVISDRGPQFTSALAWELTCLLQYNIALSTTYHPQTGGETEQVNQELETYLQWATKPMQCLHDFDWWVNIGRPIDARPLHMWTVRKPWSRAFQTYIHLLGNSDSIRNYSGIKQEYSLYQFCCWQFEVWKLYDEIRYYIINGSCDTL